MRNLLALVGLVVVGFVGLGWYLDWYNFKTNVEANGHRTVNVDVNTAEIKDDLNKAKNAVRDILNKDKTTTPQVPGVSVSVSPNGVNVQPTSAPSFGTPDTFVLPAIEFPAPPSGSLPKPPALPR